MTTVIVAVIAGSIAVFISRPLIGYTASAQRATLVDQAELALRRMGRDLQRAVPNSIRVNVTNNSIEYLNTVEGIRYRASGPGTPIDFNAATTLFDVIGTFQTALTGAQGYYAIIYNTGALTGAGAPSAGVNAYSSSTAPGPFPVAGSHVITAAGTVQINHTVSPPAYDQVSISGGGRQFAFPSPQQRLYISDGPVSYLCDTGTGTINRYSGYAIQSTQPVTAATFTALSASAGTLVDNVTACSFTYTPGSTQSNATVSMRIALTEGGETVTLMRQVSIRNIP